MESNWLIALMGIAMAIRSSIMLYQGNDDPLWYIAGLCVGSILIGLVIGNRIHDDI